MWFRRLVRPRSRRSARVFKTFGGGVCCFAEFVTIFHFPPKGEIYHHNERGIYGIITHSFWANYSRCDIPIYCTQSTFHQEHRK